MNRSVTSRDCVPLSKQYGIGAYLPGVAVHAEIVTADEIGKLASFWILAPVHRVNMNFIFVCIIDFHKKIKRGQSTVKNVSQHAAYL
jgi:hypothetical protein